MVAVEQDIAQPQLTQDIQVILHHPLHLLLLLLLTMEVIVVVKEIIVVLMQVVAVVQQLQVVLAVKVAPAVLESQVVF